MLKDTHRMIKFRKRIKVNINKKIIKTVGVDPLSDDYIDQYELWKNMNIYDVTYENFNFDAYIENNYDLKSINNKLRAFTHYKNHGIKELRSPYKNQKIVNKGQWGCLMSHINILKKSIYENYNNIIIFEDDVVFIREKSVLSNIINNIKILMESKWKIIYLGATQYDWENVDIKNYYYKANKTTGSFAILLNKDIFSELLDKYEELNNPVDHCLMYFQEKYKDECFVIYPNLVIANLEKSNIGENRKNEEWCERFKWKINDYIF